MEVVKISAKEMNKKYCGARGGWITGTHYALFEEGKGFVTLDNKRPYILQGKYGKAALESIIEAGGLAGPVNYVAAI